MITVLLVSLLLVIRLVIVLVIRLVVTCVMVRQTARDGQQAGATAQLSSFGGWFADLP